MLAGSRPKVVYTSWAAAFAVEIWARLRQMTSTVWKNDFGTLLLQQQWHPRKWQDCVVSGLEIERHATGHETSSQQ